MPLFSIHKPQLMHAHSKLQRRSYFDAAPFHIQALHFKRILAVPSTHLIASPVESLSKVKIERDFVSMFDSK
jgi:hypothetical protein